jgi:hypothetical protein
VVAEGYKRPVTTDFERHILELTERCRSGTGSGAEVDAALTEGYALVHLKEAARLRVERAFSHPTSTGVLVPAIEQRAELNEELGRLRAALTALAQSVSLL